MDKVIEMYNTLSNNKRNLIKVWRRTSVGEKVTRITVEDKEYGVISIDLNQDQVKHLSLLLNEEYKNWHNQTIITNGLSRFVSDDKWNSASLSISNDTIIINGSVFNDIKVIVRQSNYIMFLDNKFGYNIEIKW